MAKFTRILSIDGGGIRGIIPGQVLVALERKLQKRTRKSDARIADYFDLIAGTSTGGILTCIYLCPDLESKTPKVKSPRPRFTAEQAVDLYLERGDEIFDISLWQKFRSLGGARDEKYTADGLEETLDDYLGKLELRDLLKPCLITAYDIKRRRTKFFAQHAAKKSSGENFLVRDVARATSAAPTFFEVARVKSSAKIPYPLIDGGVFANNPTLCAYAEVRKQFPKSPTAKDMAILSLGTGSVKNEYSYKDAKDWGALQWVLPLIDIMMSGVSETVHYQLEQIFDSIDAPDNYLRVNAEIEPAHSGMDNALMENLLYLQQKGERIAKDFDGKLDDFVELLLKK